MSLKICLTAFISALFLSFPQNLIGCSDAGDPHDYFTSFFSRDLNNTPVYRPFYYTSLLTFYDDWEEDTITSYENDPIIKEWQAYCGANASAKEVADFIYRATEKEFAALRQHLKTNAPLTTSDSFRKNPMTQCLISRKAEGAISYLAFAKKMEQFSTSSSVWEAPPPRDSSKLNTYLAEAEQLFQATSDVFLKTKYAFMVCKIAFYNNRFTDCIQWYDRYFSSANTAAVSNFALSYKAGSLFRLGKKREAAYFFAKAFQASEARKKQHFLGFLWATDRCNPDLKEAYIAAATTAEDKALLLALFAMHGMHTQQKEIETIYSLQPSSPLLPLLTIREINKIEEQYLTPMLAKEEGKPYYYWWAPENPDTTQQKQSITSFISTLEKLYKEGKAIDREVYITGATYLAFIAKDFPKAKVLLNEANKAATNAKTKDQLQLIQLLISVNEKQTIDSSTEFALLPSLQWLVEKAKKDNAYAVFKYNFFSQLLAKKYQLQNDRHKAALVNGIAINSLEYIQNEMTTEQLLNLNQYFIAATTPFEKFLIQHTSLTNEQVIDVIGTSYLRDHNFSKAIEWLTKAKDKASLIAFNYNYTTDKEVTINVNPLHDYLNDWQRYDKPLAKPYTKLSLAQKLLELQHKADTAQNTDTKARTYYQLASALYNMSHYGNSWNAVAYYRSGADWNTGIYNTTWQKEYYGVYKAKDYYQKAYTLSKDKEFKAAAYFLMAKCVQRQIPTPAYNYNNYEQYEKDMLVFEKKFRNNPLFPQFIKEFNTTKFYQYTYNRCSYLQDFVKANSNKNKQ